MPGHAALWTGSAHLDLLGARVLPGLRLRLGEVLPRFGPRRIADAVGLSDFDLRPISLAAIRRLGAFSLASGAAAALAARPDLVRADVQAELPPNPVSLSDAIRDGHRSFEEAGGDQAYFGDPAASTAAEGRDTIRVLGEILAEAVRSAMG